MGAGVQFNTSPLEVLVYDPFTLALQSVSHHTQVDHCVLLYILAIYKVIAGLIHTSDCAHSWQCYSAAPDGDQADVTVT